MNWILFTPGCTSRCRAADRQLLIYLFFCCSQAIIFFFCLAGWVYYSGRRPSTALLLTNIQECRCSFVKWVVVFEHLTSSASRFSGRCCLQRSIFGFCLKTDSQNCILCSGSLRGSRAAEPTPTTQTLGMNPNNQTLDRGDPKEGDICFFWEIIPRCLPFKRY